MTPDSISLRNIALEHAIKTGTPPDQIVAKASEFLTFLQTGSAHLPQAERTVPRFDNPTTHPAESSPASHITRLAIVRYPSDTAESGEIFQLQSVVYRHQEPISVAYEVSPPGIFFSNLSEMQEYLTKHNITPAARILDYHQDLAGK